MSAVSAHKVRYPAQFEQPCFPVGDVDEHGAQLHPCGLQGSMLVEQGCDPFAHRRALALTDLNELGKEILFLVSMVMRARYVEIAHDVSGCLLRLRIRAMQRQMRRELLERGGLRGDALMARPEHFDRFVERGRGLDQKAVGLHFALTSFRFSRPCRQLTGVPGRASIGARTARTPRTSTGRQCQSTRHSSHPRATGRKRAG